MLNFLLIPGEGQMPLLPPLHPCKRSCWTNKARRQKERRNVEYRSRYRKEKDPFRRCESRTCRLIPPVGGINGRLSIAKALRGYPRYRKRVITFRLPTGNMERVTLPRKCSSTLRSDVHSPKMHVCSFVSSTSCLF